MIVNSSPVTTAAAMQHLLLRKQSLPLLVAPGSSWLKREEKSQRKVPRKNQASTQKPKGSLQESVMLGLFSKLTLGERERRSWVRARGTRERCPPL